MRISSIKKSEAGVTLVDVVMAIGVLGVMAGGLFGSFRYGFFTLQMVRENQRATQVLLEKAETIRLYSWTQVNAPGFITNRFTEPYDPTGPANAQGVIYTGQVDITDFPIATTYSTNMRQVKVTLTWTSRDIPRSRSLTTYIAKDGMQNYVY